MWIWVGLAVVILLCVAGVIFCRDWDGLTGLGIICASVLFVGGLIGGISAAAFWLDRASCEQTATALGVPYRYDIPGGCFVQDHGKWVPFGTWVNLHDWHGNE